MGFFQSFKNTISRVGDVLDGRKSNLYTILKDFVTNIDINSSRVSDANSRRLNINDGSLHVYLTRQMAFLCEARAVLRFYTAKEIFIDNMADKHREVSVSMAMQRVMLAFGAKAGFHTTLRAILSGLDLNLYLPEGEKSYLGFNIYDEYRKLDDKVEARSGDMELEQYCREFPSSLPDRAFTCLCERFKLDQDLVKDGSCFHNAWHDLSDQSFKDFMSSLSQVRLTDISKYYV